MEVNADVTDEIARIEAWIRNKRVMTMLMGGGRGDLRYPIWYKRNNASFQSKNSALRPDQNTEPCDEVVQPNSI
jgi:hypothetical protein